ncbi:hypothetical protein DMUE_1838 [Dictyocoela muelleri]|nr:hypothetical protein DMUE_1838 [Dictyocoela muelleri]
MSLNYNEKLNDQPGTSFHPNTVSKKQINNCHSNHLQFRQDTQSGIKTNISYQINIPNNTNQSILNNQDINFKPIILKDESEALNKSGYTNLPNKYSSRFIYKIRRLAENINMKITDILPGFKLENIIHNQFIKLPSTNFDNQRDFYFGKDPFRIESKGRYTLQNLIEDVENEFGDHAHKLSN